MGFFALRCPVLWQKPKPSDSLCEVSGKYRCKIDTNDNSSYEVSSSRKSITVRISSVHSTLVAFQIHTTGLHDFLVKGNQKLSPRFSVHFVYWRSMVLILSAANLPFSFFFFFFRLTSRKQHFYIDRWRWSRVQGSCSGAVWYRMLRFTANSGKRQRREVRCSVYRIKGTRHTVSVDAPGCVSVSRCAKGRE